MARPPRLGDVVRAAPSYTREAGLPDEAGLYLVERKRDALVYFARSRRSAWVPLRWIAPADAAPGWLSTVAAAARLLDASEVELEEDDAGRLEVRLGTSHLDLARIRALELLLGPLGPRIRILPRAMSRLHVAFPVEVVPAEAGGPDPAGADPGS